MSDRLIENEVIRHWQKQTSIRRIATELRISRYLVKRIIMDHQAGRTEGRRTPICRRPRNRPAAFSTGMSLSGIFLCAGLR